MLSMAAEMFGFDGDSDPEFTEEPPVEPKPAPPPTQRPARKTTRRRRRKPQLAQARTQGFEIGRQVSFSGLFDLSAKRPAEKEHVIASIPFNVKDLNLAPKAPKSKKQRPARRRRKRRRGKAVVDTGRRKRAKLTKTPPPHTSDPVIVANLPARDPVFAVQNPSPTTTKPSVPELTKTTTKSEPNYRKSTIALQTTPRTRPKKTTPQAARKNLLKERVLIVKSKAGKYVFPDVKEGVKGMLKLGYRVSTSGMHNALRGRTKTHAGLYCKWHHYAITNEYKWTKLCEKTQRKIHARLHPEPEPAPKLEPAAPAPPAKLMQSFEFVIKIFI